MLKSLLIFTLFISFNSFADNKVSSDIIVTKVLEQSDHYSDQLSVGVLAPQVHDFSTINTSFSFRLKTNSRLKSAKKIAQKLFVELFGATPIISETDLENENYEQFISFPCGTAIIGDFSQGFMNKTTYSISSSGDGFIDTCNDQGFPGAWEQNILVEYDSVLNKGVINIESYSE